MKIITAMVQPFMLSKVTGALEEIAKMLGVAVGTSKSQLHKARMKLRKLLKEQNPASIPSG